MSLAHFDDLNSNYSHSEKQQALTRLDLEFLRMLTGGEGLVLDSEQKHVKPRLINPVEYFFENIPKYDNTPLSLETLIKDINNPGIELLYEKLTDTLKKIPSGMHFDKNEGPTGYNKGLATFFPKTAKSNNFYSAIQDILDFSTNREQHSKAYRQVRNNVVDQLKIETDSGKWGNPFDYLNNKLPHTEVGKPFDHVFEEQLKIQSNTKDSTRYNHFMYLFVTLDTYGFQRDKKSRNLIIDSTHAFYAAHCDYFVIEDKKAYHKSKEVYKKLNIETMVLNPEEFIAVVKGNPAIQPRKWTNWFELINNTIENEEPLLNGENDEKNPVLIYSINPKYFDFFNRMQITRHDEYITASFYKKVDNYSTFFFWQEIETLVKCIVNHFGSSDFNMESLSKAEKEQINTDQWKGRFWFLSKESTVHLTLREGSPGPMLNFKINMNATDANSH
ncbi:MAG: hypothetical protein CL840_11955 [Crocinitomicaceae bacterium]|nr:hypothetical protein [Crocinitomicaceae bacterium]